MRYQLDMTVRRVEGALNRVLGIVQRRGYEPIAIDADMLDGDDRWRLSMTVQSERSGDALKMQLAGLYECLSVEVASCP